MKKVLLVAALAVLSFSACKNDGQVVAKVGGTKITENMLIERLAMTPPEYQNYVNTPMGRKNFIDGVVREQIMLESAKEAGVAKKADFKNQVKAFEEQQERQLSEYKKQLMFEMFIRDLYTNITATDADIQTYYQENKVMFDKPVEYTVRHILVPTQAEAEAALARIKAGEKFTNVAKEVSVDNSRDNGGLIGPFKKGDLVSSFEKVALSLKNNEMSGVVETPFGYHIISKVSEKTLPKMSFEQSAALIKRLVEQERFDSWYDQMKKTLKVKVNYEFPEAK